MKKACSCRTWVCCSTQGNSQQCLMQPQERFEFCGNRSSTGRYGMAAALRLTTATGPWCPGLAVLPIRSPSPRLRTGAKGEVRGGLSAHAAHQLALDRDFRLCLGRLLRQCQIVDSIPRHRGIRLVFCRRRKCALAATRQSCPRFSASGALGFGEHVFRSPLYSTIPGIQWPDSRSTCSKLCSF
jgi:hypothetical protein